MIWNLISLIYRWLTIKRWNNYPRIDTYCESEHISLKLNIALVLVRILQEKWKNIDLLYIYKNIFWTSFFTFIYSDLKYDLKEYVKQANGEVYKQFRKQLWSFFLDFDLSTNIKNDMREIFEEHTNGDLFESKHALENKIIWFIKTIETKIEIENNAKIYNWVYQDMQIQIEKKLQDCANELDFDEFETLYNYLNNFVKLKFAYRRNRHNRKYPVSVLSHLYFVFSFSYFLALLKNLNKQETENILNISLLHDLPESITWDVITPTKNSVYGFRKILEKFEEESVKKEIILDLEKFSFAQDFQEIMLMPFENKLGKIAKYSDSLSAMFEAKLEGNTTTYKDIKNSLWMKNDEQLDYILKFWVDFFEEDVEEKRWNFIKK